MAKQTKEPVSVEEIDKAVKLVSANTDSTDTAREVMLAEPKLVLKDFALYKRLKDLGYPQGGQGSYILHPETDEKVYVPQPSEIYAQTLGDPEDWRAMTDGMARVWIIKHESNATH